MEHLFWIIPLILAVGLAGFLWYRNRSAFDLAAAKRAFGAQRSQLQAEFFQAAAASGKPRGLRWKDCQWSELTAWVRDKETGQVLALVGVTISFEAIEGGDMEGLEAVGNLRNASAVFFHDGGRWRTVGRVIFNLNPDEAVEH